MLQQLILALVAVLELILHQAQFALGATVFGEQAFVVTVQLGDFVLTHQRTLLCLTQLHLQLLELPFVASLFLLALFFGGVAIMLQRVAGMQVLFFQRADLLVLVLQAQLEVGQCLVQSGVARLLGLQHRAGFVQRLGFLGQRCALNVVLLLQLFECLAYLLEFRFQRFALFLELLTGVFDGLLRLFFQALGEARDQCRQLVVDRFCGRFDRLTAVVQLFQVAMDRGFRTGVAQFDAYCIDAGVFASGQNRCARYLNHRFIYAATGHVNSYRFVLWYMPPKYAVYHAENKVK
ncbi:membrane hypothetical protein [Pseudomonas serboccidentalis]